MSCSAKISTPNPLFPPKKVSQPNPPNQPPRCDFPAPDLITIIQIRPPQVATFRNARSGPARRQIRHWKHHGGAGGPWGFPVGAGGPWEVGKIIFPQKCRVLRLGWECYIFPGGLGLGDQRRFLEVGNF